MRTLRTRPSTRRPATRGKALPIKGRRAYHLRRGRVSVINLRTAVIAAVLLAARWSAASIVYQIQMLADTGGSFSRARAVNDSGVAVGEAFYSGGGSAEHAFEWTGAAAEDLGTLGGTRSRAMDINNAGTVGGWAQNASGQQRPALWSGGEAAGLPTLGGASGGVWDVNEAGEAAGYAYLTASTYHAVQWALDGTANDLGTLGGTYSIAYGLNDDGLVVGGADGVDGRQRACFWTASGATDIGGLSGGAWDTARGVNALGQMILWGRPLGAPANRAAFWGGDFGVEAIDLGTLGGDESWAYGLNDAGWVVGWAELAAGNYHAFVWDGSSMTDLGTLGGQFSSAYGINEQGVIVGYAYDAAGRTRAVQWVPVEIPEPSTVALMLIALWVARRRARQSQ